MSLSNKPQAGQPLAISASALADAYRAADIVLGKDPTMENVGVADSTQCITITKQFYVPNVPKVGDAVGFDRLTFDRRKRRNNWTNPQTEEEINKYSQNEKILHTSNNAGKDFSHRFGIVRKARMINDYSASHKIWKVTLQIKGLVCCRVLMYAYATSCGPPIDNLLAAQHGNWYRPYPVSNWYGCCDIISIGQGVVIDADSNQPHDFKVPGIYECLIDLG